MPSNRWKYHIIFGIISADIVRHIWRFNRRRVFWFSVFSRSRNTVQVDFCLAVLGFHRILDKQEGWKMKTFRDETWIIPCCCKWFPGLLNAFNKIWDMRSPKASRIRVKTSMLYSRSFRLYSRDFFSRLIRGEFFGPPVFSVDNWTAHRAGGFLSGLIRFLPNIPADEHQGWRMKYVQRWASFDSLLLKMKTRGKREREKGCHICLFIALLSLAAKKKPPFSCTFRETGAILCKSFLKNS